MQYCAMPMMLTTLSSTGTWQVSKKTILTAEAFEYLGVTITRSSTTDASILRRADAASSALSNLKQLRILVRGMNMHHALYVYNNFVVSRWTYASFLQPYTTTVRSRLDGIDAGFLSATLIACRIRGTGKRHSTLNTLRALARIPSPQLRRQVDAHRYVSRLHRIGNDDTSSPNTKRHEAAALAALPSVPGFSDLVPDIGHPWTPQDRRAAHVAE